MIEFNSWTANRTQKTYGDFFCCDTSQANLVSWPFHSPFHSPVHVLLPPVPKPWIWWQIPGSSCPSCGEIDYLRMTQDDRCAVTWFTKLAAPKMRKVGYKTNIPFSLIITPVKHNHNMYNQSGHIWSCLVNMFLEFGERKIELWPVRPRRKSRAAAKKSLYRNIMEYRNIKSFSLGNSWDVSDRFWLCQSVDICWNLKPTQIAKIRFTLWNSATVSLLDGASLVNHYLQVALLCTSESLPLGACPRPSFWRVQNLLSSPKHQKGHRGP